MFRARLCSATTYMAFQVPSAWVDMSTLLADRYFLFHNSVWCIHGLLSQTQRAGGAFVEKTRTTLFFHDVQHDDE